MYLENKNNYVFVNKHLNETALRVIEPQSLKDCIFVVKGNHKEILNELKDDLSIMEWFVKNVDSFWSDDVDSLKNYINDNFIR